MQPIYNTTGKDDADYSNKVRDAVMRGLKGSVAPKRVGGYYDRVVKSKEDGEEG